jgi:TolB protein
MWSPDARRILFTTSVLQGVPQLAVIDADGRNQHELGQGSGTMSGAGWSPDGTQIACIRELTGNGNLFVVNVEGTNAKNLSDDPSIAKEDAWGHNDRGLAWSRDGRNIAISSWRNQDDDIFIIPSKGGPPFQVTKSKGTDTSPKWLRREAQK